MKVFKYGKSQLILADEKAIADSKFVMGPYITSFLSIFLSSNSDELSICNLFLVKSYIRLNFFFFFRMKNLVFSHNVSDSEVH